MSKEDHLYARWLVVAAVMLSGLCPVCPVFGANLKTLPGHVPAVVNSLPPLGPLPPTNELRLAIGLPLRDPAGLDKFLADLYDPASVNFHQFLTPEEFAARFGPTEADWAAVKEFARTNGLVVTGTPGNRLLLDVRGSVTKVERSFHLHLLKFKHPTEARDFYAPDADPQVPADLPVLDVQGLSNDSRPRPKLVKPNAMKLAPRTGSAPDQSGSYIGDDFRNAYVPGSTLTGAGQLVGLVEFDGFYSNDIAAYAQSAGGGRTNIVIQTVLLDGYNGVPTTGPNSGNSEVSLDIEMVMAMAPGLSKIVVFEAGANGIQNDILNSMVTFSNSVRQLSCSWGWVGGPSNTTDNIFKNMAAAGQSFFNASGDSDAFTVGSNSVNGVDNPSPSLAGAPSSCPYITQVGGTTLTMNGTGASYTSETVWNWNNSGNPGVGSSGGVSSYYPLPYWQTNLGMTTSLGSLTNRNIPDVALTAANVYVVSGGSGVGAGGTGGTSCASQLWAGFAALVNQQAALAGKPPVGFLNPALYTIGKSANYTNCFHDITTGNNFWSNSPALYPAVSGYDLCTGWGTPNGANLINALAGPPLISPMAGFVAAGAAGGPFSPTSVVFSLTNSSTSNLVWSLVNTSLWLNVSVTSGTLTPGSATNFTVILAATAGNLSPGIYTAEVVFTNHSVATILNMPFQLSVGQSLVRNGGFETGSSSPWTLADSGGQDLVDNGYYLNLHSGTFDFVFGQVGSLAFLSQSLATVPGQAYLISFWYENLAAGTTQQFIANWITNATGTNVLMNRLNPPAFLWTATNFIVTATGTNSTLQFAARNDPSYFGLDDVSVTPIPTPTFTGFSEKTNALTLTWNSLAGVVYQVQYKTNLLQTNWVNLATNTASGGIMNFTNVIGSDPRRFYRIYRLP